MNTPDEIQIQPVPADIITTECSIEKNECYANAYQLAKANADTTLVEGVLLLIGKDKRAKAAAHAWNERAGSHFDITSTLWKGPEYEQIESLHYFRNITHETRGLPNPDDFKFDPVTLQDMRDLNAQIGLGN